MNNEPVAWMLADKEAEHIRSIMAVQHDFVPEGCVEIPLYTHPVKELDEQFKKGFEAGKEEGWKAHKFHHPAKEQDTDCQYCKQGCIRCDARKQLTDEEINKLWAESHEDGIAMQQGFTTQQHYFAHLILRKASEK